jgi:hypothetical protein
MAERTREERVRWAQGQIAERLVVRSDLFRSLVPRGCKVFNGHKPEISFSNPQEVKHLDLVVVDLKTLAIRTICEVKSTTTRFREFRANGQCVEVMTRAQDAGIPIFLAIVRLRRALPDSTDTPESAKAYEQYLRENPHEYSIELYKQAEFEFRGNTFVVG